MEVAIYARVSTEHQNREETIVNQLTLLQQWVKQNGHVLNPEHIYTDEGFSGSRLDRPGLDALRDAASFGNFKLLAVLSPDRLARKYAYQVLLLEELQRHGCEVLFLQHPISTDPNDQLLLQIQGAIAEYERAVLSERFRRGKLVRAKAGQWIGGRAPYGYRYVARQVGSRGYLVLDEAEAEFIQMVYGWFVNEQMTIRQLLKRLNHSQWRPRSGKPLWSASVIHRILSDPIYTGTAYANRYHYVKAKKPRTIPGPHSPERPCRQLRAREEWIAISVPAIIDQPTFELAQAQLAHNAKLSFRNNTKYRYLLRCLLSCKTCGLAMFGRTIKAGVHQAESSYYLCHGKDLVVRDLKTRCTQPRTRANELEQVIWEQVRKLLEDRKPLVQQFQQFSQQADLNDSPQLNEISKVAAQLKRLDNEEKRLIDAYQAEIFSLTELGERRRQLVLRRQSLEAQREKARRQMAEVAQSQQVLSDLTSFSERIKHSLATASFEEKQAILQLVVERIIVGEDSLEIHHVIPLRTNLSAQTTGVAPPGVVAVQLRSDFMGYTALSF